MINSLQLGQSLSFKGQTYLVHAIKEDMDTVWLKPASDGEPEVYGKTLVEQEAAPLDVDFIPKHTKAEIDARVDELQKLQAKLGAWTSGSPAPRIAQLINKRIKQLALEREKAPDDIFSAIVESHKVLCRVKQMGEKEAYGQDPAFYYSAGVAGEAGELLNKIVKALRSGGDASKGLRAAVFSELPDVVIYAFVLAYVLDIDLTRLVTEKASIVVKRAVDGYYGGPLLRLEKRGKPAKCPTCKKPRGPRCPEKCDENH